jgi:hypothetical protein
VRAHSPTQGVPALLSVALHPIALLALALLLPLSACDLAEAPAEPGPPDLEAATDTAASEAAAPWRGELLAMERFEDARFENRGWYDGPSGRIVEGGPAGYAGERAFLCRFAPGGTGCADGHPGRLEFEESEGVHLAYRVRYDPGWEGSGRPYHPHEFYLMTNLDDRFVGPARTHLTVYVEQIGGTPLVALQDSRNVDPACVLRDDDSVVGCDGGRVEDHPFGEDRSVAACNGLVGEVQGRSCYPTGEDRWYSSRSWHADEPVLAEEGPEDAGGWRLVEAVVVMNSIIDGVGVPDGRIRLWVDGEVVVSSDEILFRTGRHPEMRFNQLLLAPYIGDGSPVEQSFRIGSIVLARAVVP